MVPEASRSSVVIVGESAAAAAPSSFLRDARNHVRLTQAMAARYEKDPAVKHLLTDLSLAAAAWVDKGTIEIPWPTTSVVRRTCLALFIEVFRANQIDVFKNAAEDIGAGIAGIGGIGAEMRFKEEELQEEDDYAKELENIEDLLDGKMIQEVIMIQGDLDVEEKIDPEVKKEEIDADMEEENFRKHLLMEEDFFSNEIVRIQRNNARSNPDKNPENNEENGSDKSGDGESEASANYESDSRSVNEAEGAIITPLEVENVVDSSNGLMDKVSEDEIKTLGEFFQATVHWERKRRGRKRKNPRELLCNLCGKSNFKSQQALKYHLQTHEFVQYLCPHSPDCPRRFRSKLGLVNHMKIHEGNLDICEECGRGFITKQLLDEHRRRIHTFERPYACDRCDKCFLRSDKLLHHRRREHTGEKPYKCKLCDWSGVDSSSSIHHRRRHGTRKRIFRPRLHTDHSDRSWNTILGQEKEKVTNGKDLYPTIEENEQKTNEEMNSTGVGSEGQIDSTSTKEISEKERIEKEIKEQMERSQRRRLLKEKIERQRQEREGRWREREGGEKKERIIVIGTKDVL